MIGVRFSMSKSIAALKKNLTKHFNAFIKLTHSEDGWCECYTCGKHLPLGHFELHCGHFLGKGANPVHRYNEDNCRPQCEQCNYFGGGEPEKFEARLREEIGDERVNELLETRFGDSKKPREWYQEKIVYYRDRVNDLSGCLGSW